MTSPKPQRHPSRRHQWADVARGDDVLARAHAALDETEEALQRLQHVLTVTIRELGDGDR